MCHPKGRSAAKDARSALTRRPARSYSAPTIPATVRHARRRSGERHERSIPRPPALPAPLADPPIAPQPTHTRLRRAHSWRASQPGCGRTNRAEIHHARDRGVPVTQGQARHTACSQTCRRHDVASIGGRLCGDRTVARPRVARNHADLPPCRSPTEGESNGPDEISRCALRPISST